MSLPYSAIVPISASVESAVFANEKKHLLLATTNSLMPSTVSYLEFSGAGAIAEFGAYFGKDNEEYKQVQKYFGFLSKGGNSPEKLVVARWYKANTAAFLKGSKITASTTSIVAISDGKFKISIDSAEHEISVDFSVIQTEEPTYSEIAGVLQTALQTSFEDVTCEYSSVTGGMIITSATTGISSRITVASAGTSGTDVSKILGLADGIASQGVNAESYADFCDRIYNANTAGYSITTLESLSDDEIKAAVTWLQSSASEQTYNTVVRLVFDITDKDRAVALQTALSGATGYVVCYDPNEEYVNILDCAICASIDYTIENGAINFNFQPATGYTAITGLGTVVDYQQGLTNTALVEELNEANINFVYSLGFGSQTQTMYGFGLMAGDYGTEDVQVNESALETNIQTAIINGLVSLNKVKLRGTDARNLVCSMVSTPLDLFVTNGSIASDGTLTQSEKSAVVLATGDESAVDYLENNGYYVQVKDLTDDDITKRQVRVVICYLAAGVVNKVRIINKIYGA